MAIFVKDPADRIDYSMDWGAAFLGPHLIAQSDWSVLPDDSGAPSLVASSHDGRTSAVSVDGGDPGRSFDLTNAVILSNGERVQRSITLLVEQR